MTVTKKYVEGLELKVGEFIDIRGSAGPNYPDIPQYFPLRSEGNYLGVDLTHLRIQDRYSRIITIPLEEIQNISLPGRKKSK